MSPAWLLGAWSVWAASSTAGLTPLEIMDRANKVLRGDSSHARLVMTIVTPSWTRQLEVEAWNQGRQKAFILIHSPPKEKGTTTTYALYGLQ